MNELRSDEDFLAAFLDCSLPPEEFNHRAHVRLAWLILRRHPLEEAIERICAGILRYATSLGASGKFHRTLSEAIVRVMAQRGAGSATITWEDFLLANPDLLQDVRGLLAAYYSPERLAAPEAKHSFIPPDRRPLPK